MVERHLEIKTRWLAVPLLPIISMNAVCVDGNVCAWKSAAKLDCLWDVYFAFVEVKVKCTSSRPAGSFSPLVFALLDD